MAERATLVTELRVDDQLTGKLGAAKAQLTQLDATARKAGASVGGLGSSLGGIAKAGATAFVAFKALDIASDFLGGAIKGAIEEEAGIKRLTQALQANIPAWDGSTAAIEKTIAARTALGFKDDELRASFTALVAATKDSNAAFSIQSTAIDLARFKSISLEDATARLIKVNAGSFRALKDLGIELKAGASGMQALGEVQKRVAGQGEGFLDTTAGSIARAEAAVDKLSDAIGERLSGAIAKGADVLTDFLNKDLPSFAENSQREVDELAGFFQDLIGAGRDLAGIEDGVAAGAVDVAAAANIAGAGIAAWTAKEREGTAAAIAFAAANADTSDALLEAREKALESAKAAAVATALLSDASAELDNDLTSLTGDLGASTTALRVWTGAMETAFQAAQKGLHVPMDAAETGLRPVSSLPSNGSTVTGADVFLDRQRQAADLRAKNEAEAERLAEDARRKREQAADEALRKAKQRADEEARAYEKALGRAFDNAKQRANSLFDTLHARHTQAIRDAETLAEKQHAGALKVIADALKFREIANAAPVNAATAALNDRQQAQSRRGLVESLQGAQLAVQTNTDPTAAADLARAVRDATEALENFDDAAKIARLTTVQGTEDAKAKATADKLTAAADRQLAEAKAQAQKDLDAETIAAQKRKKDFETALDKLERADLKAKKTPAEQQADIKKLEGQFGITTDKSGFHHIDDPLVTAIKNVTIQPPVVTVTNTYNPVFRVSARDVAVALASGASPTSTPMVRTGAAGRS